MSKKAKLDLFGHAKPVQIEVGEWWFNGRIIQEQNHPQLAKWISFADDLSPFTKTHTSKKEAIEYALDNPCKHPKNLPVDYIG